MLDALSGDTRYAVRRSRRAPLAAITVILVLSLGIGSNVGLITLLNSLTTLPPAGLDRDPSVVRIRGTLQAGRTTLPQPRLLSWPEVQAYAERIDLFSQVASHAEETGLVTSLDPSSPVITRLIYASADYFTVLGVRPALGTPPLAEQDVRRLTMSPTAMISHAFWQQKFGAASDVIGRTVRVNDVTLTIVGVAPPRFTGTGGGQALTLWVPLAAYPLLQKRTPAVFSSPDSLFLYGSARLRPRIASASATPIITAIASRSMVPTAVGDGMVLRGADVVPMLAGNERVANRDDQVVSAAAAGTLALVILLITCTNAGALMIGLAVARRREMAVRLSLGAPRRRLVRQLVTESVLLALAAGTLGLLVTAAGVGLAGRALPDLPLVVDWRVTAASFGLALMTGILAGLSPALHATRVPVHEVLRSASSAIAAPPPRSQLALVVAQVALTQPLLVGLGVTVSTMAGELKREVPPGVANQVVEIELDPWAGRVEGQARESRIAALVNHVAEMPGIRAAFPMQMGTVVAPLAVHPADRVGPVAPVMQATLTSAPQGFFSAFDIRIIRGRDFTPGEFVHTSRDGAPPSFEVAIIGSDLARRLWGAADPIGRRLVQTVSGTPSSGMMVVGVVDETAAGPSDVNGQVRIYVPYAAMTTGVIARTTGPALPLVQEIRRSVVTQAPEMPVVRVETRAQREAERRLKVRRVGFGVTAAGLVALLLSALSMYAVISYSVGQRTREIGIRAALGAGRSRIVGMFLGRGLALAAAGLLLGLPLSLAAIRAISAALTWPLATPPRLVVGVAAAVLVVIAAAVWGPARRAGAVDPATALQDD